MTARGPNYGWLSTLGGLPNEDAREIRQSLAAFVHDASREQLAAWDESVPLVKDAAAHTVGEYPPASANAVVLEYELPREGGRRPDLVVLQGGTVAVVEFKGKSRPTRADLDQVAAYARDLRSYHSGSHGHLVVPVLVPTHSSGTKDRYDDVYVVSPPLLGDLFLELSRTSAGVLMDGEDWTQADYAPLPGLVEAARAIFHHRPLPFIRKAQSAGIPQALAHLVGTAHRAAESRTRHLVLLTGVPGAGKTLVGLQFVHEPRLADLVVASPGRSVGAPAVFLSGNGPLVRVLRHALHGEAGEEKVFVDGIKNYLKTYALRKAPRVPPEHILVFDEAQRAWDGAMVNEKQGVDRSEPQVVIDLSASVPEWSMVLGLVGEGQEIHKGEEAGLKQWAEALAAAPSRQSWVVHGPARLEGLFSTRGIPFEESPTLDLTITLRSHLSSTVHEWVAGFLSFSGRPASLATLATEIRADGFCMYVSRSLGDATSYAEQRYDGLRDKRYGLLASSRAKNLEACGIENSYQVTKQLREGPWYNDEPNSPFTCCKFRSVATEFASQGLELDLPVVCWGDDLFRSQGTWVIAKRRLSTDYRDPDQLRINSYRVLLTRGRDGFVIFVPPDHGDGMDATAAYLQECGVLPLRDPVA